MSGQQLDALAQVVALALLLALVAGVARGAVLSLTQGLAARPARFAIAPAERDRIARRYGTWAARRAEAACPEGDVACVEREARRLFQTIHRRFGP